VGVQAVQNVVVGRYKLIPTQVMDYCYGLYGRPPAPIDPEVQKVALRGYKNGQTPVTGRPADYLEPEMEKARASIKDVTRDIGDVLTAALYPIEGVRFDMSMYGAASGGNGGDPYCPPDSGPLNDRPGMAPRRGGCTCADGPGCRSGIR
jgi:pyruvate/oxaloacetate carboxyltransferase